ncbi:hypothetical protein CAPTEDRAFT_27173, partial [Capitella teleta]
EIQIGKLPQKFVTKFLGTKRCADLWGLEAVRGPLEEMVAELKNKPKGEDLPLVNLTVTDKGLVVKTHKASKTKMDEWKDEHHIPLEFVSYGVQDTMHPRIFVYIVVKELSVRQRVTECQAFLCDSVVSARKLALSLSRSFELYAKELNGKPFKFQVDLQTPSE